MLPIHKSHQKCLQSFSSSRRVARRQVMRHLTSNGTDQCQNGSSNLLTPYRERLRSTRVVVAYPRSAFSATKRSNYAQISFDQQAQVSQGHTSCRNMGNCSTEVHGGGVLELVKPAQPASSRPKPCAFWKIPQESFRSLLVFVGKKQAMVRNQLVPQKSPASRL